MNKNKNHNTIYLLTTLAVYIGLVLVGSSPQVLAHAETIKNSQPQSFEFNSGSASVFSKLKYKSKFHSRDILPFAFLGESTVRISNWTRQKSLPAAKTNRFDILRKNNQVLIKTHLPRGSIDSLNKSEKPAR